MLLALHASGQFYADLDMSSARAMYTAVHVIMLLAQLTPQAAVVTKVLSRNRG